MFGASFRKEIFSAEIAQVISSKGNEITVSERPLDAQTHTHTHTYLVICRLAMGMLAGSSFIR